MTKVIVITGSSKGIGLSVAKYLAQFDNQIVINSRKEISQSVLDEFSDSVHPVYQMIGDVSDFAQAKVMVKDVINEFGQIDVLINNAGITKDGLFIRMKEEDFNSVIQTNLNGQFNMARHVAPAMVKARGGAIINLSSVSGVMGNAGQVNYSASKAGVIGLTKSLARELASRSITVNAIAPGFITTDMTGELSDKVKNGILENIPLGRFGDPLEIATTIEFLMNNKYVTGQVIEVNGGLHT